MSVSAGYIEFRLAYSLSPIILTGGIATAQGGAIPIIALTDPSVGGSIDVSGGVAADVGPFNSDANFAEYYPLPGGMLINNQVATYPFANQAVAANAIIAQPLNISMMMLCPAGNTGTYGMKQTTMIALQNSLAQHNGQGGTYSIVTPAYIYTFCIMTGMRDVSGGESRQSQYQWQLDFIQPLVSLQAAQQAQNGLMQTITKGTPLSGTPTWSGGLPVNNPTNALTSSLAPPGFS